MQPKILLIIFGVFILLSAIGVGLYFYFNQKGDEDKPTEEKTNTSSANSFSPTSPISSTGKELKKGSSGEDVKKLQNLINNTMNSVRVVSTNNVPAAIGEDGQFGAKTEEALRFCTGQNSTTLANYSVLVEASSQSNRTDLTPQQKQALSKAASTTGNSSLLNTFSTNFGMSTNEVVSLYNRNEPIRQKCREYADKQPFWNDYFYQSCLEKNAVK
jgi:hypothetical protein